MAFLLCASAVTVGCGDDDSGTGGAGGATSSSTTSSTTSTTSTGGDGGAGGAPAGTGAITLTVNYTGAAVGTLYGAVVPMATGGSPIAFQSVMTPTFPQVIEIADVPDGDWFVASQLDVDPASPGMPGDEDLTAITDTAVTVKGDTQAVELTLEDP